MSVAEIEETKLNLIAWIKGLNDTNMLSVIDGIRNSQTKEDWWDDLSEHEKEHLNKGLFDIKNGRVYTSEVFWDRLKN